MFIVIAYGINKLRVRYKLFIMLTIIMLSLLYVNIQNHSQIKWKWKDSVDYIKSVAGRNDVIVISPSYQILPFLYYFDDCFHSLDIDQCLYNKNLTIIYNNYEKLTKLPDRSGNILIIKVEPILTKEINISESLNDKYRLVSTKEFKSPAPLADYFLIDYLIHRSNFNITEDFIEKYTIKISITQYVKIPDKE